MFFARYDIYKRAWKTGVSNWNVAKIQYQFSRVLYKRSPYAVYPHISDVSRCVYFYFLHISIYFCFAKETFYSSSKKIVIKFYNPCVPFAFFVRTFIYGKVISRGMMRRRREKRENNSDGSVEKIASVIRVFFTFGLWSFLCRDFPPWKNYLRKGWKALLLWLDLSFSRYLFYTDIISARIKFNKLFFSLFFAFRKGKNYRLLYGTLIIVLFVYDFSHSLKEKAYTLSFFSNMRDTSWSGPLYLFCSTKRASPAKKVFQKN